MTGFQKTYQIARGPAAETFDAYAAKVSVDYAALLNADPDETIVQHFLEANPCLVPGMRSLDVLPSTFPNHALLISQPMLPGLSSKVPDFLWIAYNSVGIYPTFIEIERPGKVIFNADGSPSAKFTQASHQLVQWKAWLAKPGNDLVFKGEYGVSNAPSGSGQLDPRFILVYGRRAELHAKPDLARERALLFDNSTDFLTSYDRLVPDRMLANAITVKPLGSGRFRAIAVPPTFTLGPIDAERLVFVDGLDEAIACAEGISNERKAFLRERLPYWRQWAANEPRAWVTSTDVE